LEIGFKTTCYPTPEQAVILSQWIGHQRFIKNAKIGEWNYFRSFAKFNGIRVKPDQQYSQFISEETEFLKEVPSQILRNGTYLWMKTMMKAFKGECGFPKYRKKSQKESVLITKELYEFTTEENGRITLTLGTKKHPVGVLHFNKHNKEIETPNSIVVTKEKSGRWSLSFCYIADDIQNPNEDLQLIESLDLTKIVKAYDRGVVIPVAGVDENFELTEKEKKRLHNLDKKKKRYQRQFSRKAKGSKNKERARKKVAKISGKIANINYNFAHQTSYKLVNTDAKVIVFEKLQLKNMTKSSKGTKEKPGKNVRQKAGLNRALLKSGLGRIVAFTQYKAKKKHKYTMFVNAHYSSQECAECGHIHSDNRKNQSDFHCVSCGHKDNADRNAARVLEKRARNRITDLGTGLTLSATMSVIASEEDRKTSSRKNRKKQPSQSSIGEGKTKILEDFTFSETCEL
jgi:putative transposase